MKENKSIEYLLSKGETVQINPQGFSMYPFIYPGRDLVILKSVDTDTLKRGDVIIYRRPESILVLHRIYKCNSNEFYCVGDNQTEIEGPLPKSQIIGIMTGILRKGKYIDVNNFVYILSASIWLRLRPFRPAISKTVHFFRK